jgi:predicted hydrocarbon binding protein
MSEKNDIANKIINYLYMSVCKTMKQVPFSSRHWLEQIMMGPAQYVLDEYKDEFKFNSKNPVDVCRNFLDLLHRENFLNAGDYHLKASGENVLVKVERNNCVYREYCLRAPDEGLMFYCARLGSFQLVLRRVLGRDYSAAMEVDDKGFCHGTLFPDNRPKEEIVTREGHVLKVAGRRAVLLPQELYAYLMMSVRDHAPHALKHVLYDAGYQTGLSLAHKTRALYPDDINECLQLLMEVINNDGLGQAELVSLNVSCARAKIRCYKSFQVSIANEYGHLHRAPQVTCDLLRGVFAAYLSVLLEKEIVCEEMNCQSIGADYCEFLAMPLLETTAGGGTR